MPPKTGRLSLPDDEEVKLTKKRMEEVELKKLLRQDRLMKNKRTKDATSEKQRKVIDVLTEERNNLESNLEVMKNVRRCRLDVDQAYNIGWLISSGETLDGEIEREKKYIKDLEEQIRKESILVENHRKNIKSTGLLSDFRLVEENQRTDRVMESWKSKLHVEQVQLSKAIKDNTELRKEINLLLKSKATFNRLFEDLIQKLSKGKKIVADIVEESKAQFLKRDEVARKIELLKERDAVDLKRRQEEMQDLMMKDSEDKDLLLFKRQVFHVRKKLSEDANATKKADNQRRVQEQYLQELRETWENLQKKTEYRDVKDMCDMLVKQEQENFSLFNYNNELRYQLEAMTEKAAELMRQLEEEQDSAYQWNEEEERFQFD